MTWFGLVSEHVTPATGAGLHGSPPAIIANQPEEKTHDGPFVALNSSTSACRSDATTVAASHGTAVVSTALTRAATHRSVRCCPAGSLLDRRGAVKMRI